MVITVLWLYVVAITKHFIMLTTSLNAIIVKIIITFIIIIKANTNALANFVVFVKILRLITSSNHKINIKVKFIIRVINFGITILIINTVINIDMNLNLDIILEFIPITRFKTIVIYYQ